MIALHRVAVGGLQANCYLLVGEGRGILVDCGAEPDKIKEMVTTHAPEGVAAIVTTHQHHDHVGALAEIARWTGAPCFAGRPDAAAIEAATQVTCQRVWDDDVLRYDDIQASVVGLVGHTNKKLT